jgi:glucose/mannose transport system permease protein
MLPNSLPIIVEHGHLPFTTSGNDFLFGLPMRRGYDADDRGPQQCRQHIDGCVEYNVNMAAAVIAALPTLLVYVVAGATRARADGGAVKG